MYYRGDYYRGDYYRGDPGLFSGIAKAIGGLAKGVGGIVRGVANVGGALLPGPAGLALKGISALTGGGGSGPAIAPQAGPTFAPGTAGILPSFPFGGLQNALTAMGFPGTQLGPPIEQFPVGSMTPQGFLPGCQLKGYRPNKSSYYRAVPGNRMQAVLVPKGSVCVKSRRMNVANPRALRRSIRRAQGFAKLARRVLTFTQAKAPKGRARFKRKR